MSIFTTTQTRKKQTHHTPNTQQNAHTNIKIKELSNTTPNTKHKTQKKTIAHQQSINTHANTQHDNTPTKNNTHNNIYIYI